MDNDAVLEEFEQLWASGPNPGLSAFVKAQGEPPLSIEAIAELIKIDLHWGWASTRSDNELAVSAIVSTQISSTNAAHDDANKTGDWPYLRIEDYVNDFPSIVQLADYPYELLQEELLARMHVNHPAPLSEALDRFPQTDSKRICSVVEDAKRYHEQHSVEESDSTSFRDRFELIRQIGQGGMGCVHLARDPRLDRNVAIKTPWRHLVQFDSVARERFLREGQLAGAISHPNIVPVYEVSAADDEYFIVSEYVDGPSLKDWLTLQKRPIPPRVAAELISHIARGIHAAHEYGVVHRDLKPANVLLNIHAEFQSNEVANAVRFNGQTIRPRITDFGLASSRDADPSLTGTGAVLGTLAYMAPEQIGAKPTGPQADVFALGVMLYEALTGASPFKSDVHVATMDRVLHHDPKPVSGNRSDISRDLSAICERAIAKDVTHRYVTAEAFAADIDRYLRNEPVRARAITPVGRAARWTKRNPLPSLLAGVVCIALAWSLYQNAQLLAARDIARVKTEDLEQTVYLRDIRQAYDAWNKGSVREVDECLARQIPTEDKNDYRGFGWRILSTLAYRPPPVDLPGHEGPVNSLAVFDDGKRLASVGDDETIRVWNLENQSQEFQLKDNRSNLVRDGIKSFASILKSKSNAASKPNNKLYAVAVSPDGTKLATGNLILTLWDLETRTRIRDLAPFPTPILGVAFSPNGKYVAAHSGSEVLKVVDLQGNVLMQEQLEGSGYRIGFSPDGKQLAAPFKKNGMVGILCISTNTWEHTSEYYLGKDRGSRGVRFLDERFLIVGQSVDEKLTLIDQENQSLKALATESVQSAVQDIAVNEGLRNVAVSSTNGKIAHWSLPLDWHKSPVPKLTAPKLIPVHEGSVNSIQFVNQNQVATCGDDGLVRVVNIRKNDFPLRIEASQPHDFAVRIRPKTHELILASGAGFRRLGQQNNQPPVGESETTLWNEPFDKRISCMCLSPEGRLAGFANVVGSVAIVDLNDDKSVCRFDQIDKRASTITDIAISTDEKWVATASRDHSIRVKTVKDGREVFRLNTKGWGANVEFSPDGNFLAISDNEKDLRVIETETWTELSRANVKYPIAANGIQFVADGQSLMISHHDFAIRIWSARNLEAEGELTGHTGVPRSLALHPKGEVLVSGGSDRTVRLWHLPSRSLLGTLDTFRSSIRGCEFSDDGKQLAVIVTGNRSVAGKKIFGKPECYLWDLEKVTKASN